MFLVSLCFGVIAVVLWTGPAYAPPPFGVPPTGGLLECQATLNTCNADLDACENDFAACEAAAQVFPGDGAGDGTALSYTDNGDGTFTDNNTKFMWEKKLAANGSDGGNCTEFLQANRSVHCVNNIYRWNEPTDFDMTSPSGTLFTEFLGELNNSAFAGFSDWCIPNVKELQSIVDYGVFNPASSFPGSTAASFFGYWSATTFASSTSSRGAWISSVGLSSAALRSAAPPLAQCVHARDWSFGYLNI